MGCSPSVLLDHIHRVNANLDVRLGQDQEEGAAKKKCSKKDESRHSNGKRNNSLSNISEDEVNYTRSHQDLRNGMLSLHTDGQQKMLSVLPADDVLNDILQKCGQKLNIQVTLASDNERALGDYRTNLHDLVLIDARRKGKSIDWQSLCRSLRTIEGGAHTVIAAIVKKSAFERDEHTVVNILEIGFNRCIIESHSFLVNMNEILQMLHSDVKTQGLAATQQVLYTCLDKTTEIFFVTDNMHQIQYMNRTCETTFGYKLKELEGKSVLNQFSHDAEKSQQIGSSLQSAVEWEGSVHFRRKDCDPIQTTLRALPVSCAGKHPTHFVYVVSLLKSAQVDKDKPRGSVHSIRRGSDIRSTSSDSCRRMSLQKLHSLPLEAPITKIITLITAAQESAVPQAAALLDRAVDILRTTDLYLTNVKDESKEKDGVGTELVEALIQGPNQAIQNFRRSSNDSSSVKSVQPRPFRQVKVPPQLRDLLETSLQWDFDIFRLEELTNKQPLVHLGMNLMLQFDVGSTLKVDERTLQNWLTVIEMNYHSENCYHNSTHAADVMQATAGFLDRERLKSLMEPIDEAASLIAAAAHDIDHPGKSSAFLCNSKSQLAILYNDVTVLESHHASMTFKLTLGDDRINIFKNLDPELYKLARYNVIDMILATEMTKHFEHLAKFVNVFCPKSLSKEDLNDPDLDLNQSESIYQPENITLIKRMMIKCADVSNPCRPLAVCVEWARRIAEEYFTQTDEEKERNLPVVMPMFDRATCSIPKSQIGFVDFIINDMVEAWDAFIDMPELLKHMRENYLKWKEYDETGLTTLNDIKKLQEKLSLRPSSSRPK